LNQEQGGRSARAGCALVEAVLDGMWEFLKVDFPESLFENVWRRFGE
jgi:hypothetical protein